MDRYLVISSDTHAGPPRAAYRDYVDPQYREAFDADLATAAALRSVILESASEEQERFRAGWEEETGDGGKLASYDPAARNAELDKEGIAAEVIFPDAETKVFLTASAEERAKRRYKQLKDKGLSVTLSSLLREIEARDVRDAGRAVAPLKPAADAVLIDSTGMPIDEVVAKVLSLVRKNKHS